LNFLQQVLDSLHGHGLLQQFLLLRSQLTGSLDQGFPVLSVLVTPSDVLVGSFVEMLFNVVESVLSNVSNTEVGVLPHISFSGDEFTSEDLDDGGFTGTVGTNDGNTGVEGALEGNVVENLLGGVGVGEVDTAHLEDSLVLGFDTFQESGLGELEFEFSGSEFIVGLGLRTLLDELGQVALVSLSFLFS